MSAIYTEDRAAIIAEKLRERDALLDLCPRLKLKHHPGQVAFWMSPHAVRVMVPGNGFGKTLAMGVEADHWAWGTHPRKDTPDPSKVLIYWFCEQFKQFTAMRTKLEKWCLTKPYTWNEQDHIYTFGSGARMLVSSYDRPWQDIQGVPADLFCFDEQPPLKHWQEALQRRRADTQCKYVIAATATDGESWMEREIWKPWAEAHKSAGISLDQAVSAQVHPDYWVLDRGGIADNPGASERDVRWYGDRTWSSDEEKRVRLHGGFGRFNGRPVFSLDALAAMETRMAEWDKVRGKGRVRGLVLVKDAA